MITANLNQIVLQALGGQTPANNFAAPKLGSMLGGLTGSAPAPAPQPELPEFNIEALRKIRHPAMQKMVVEMLLQRELVRAKQLEGLEPTQQIAARKLAAIDRLQEKVNAGTATKTEEAMLEKMLAGAPMVEIGMGSPAAPTERKAIADSRASTDALLNLKQLYSDKYVGPVKGRVAGVGGLIGATSQQQENFMAATTAFQNAIIKQITGAQLSEQESERIKKQIPLTTDPPTRWNAKWTQTMKNVQDIYNRQLEVIGQSGLRVPGENQSPRPISGSDVSKISDEELLRILGAE